MLRDTAILGVLVTLASASLSVATSSLRSASRWVAALLVPSMVVAWYILGGVEKLAALWATDDEHRSVSIVWVAACSAVGLQSGARWFGSVAADTLWRAVVLMAMLTVVATANAWMQVGTIAWLLLLAAVIGAAIVARTKLPVGDVPVVIRVAIGLAALAVAGLVLGVLGLVGAAVVTTLLGLLTVICWRAVGNSLAQLAAAWRWAPVPQTAGSAALRAALGALFAIYLVAALSPETGGDALGFRLAAPLRWSAEGAITALPQMLASYGVFLAETLDLLGLALAGPSVVKLLQWGLALLLLHSAARDVLDREARNRATLWLFPFFASTVVWWQFSAGFNDVVQLLFVHCALLSLQRWRREGHGGWLWATGICAGAAAATKLNGAFAVVMVALLLLVPTSRRGSWRAYMSSAVRVGAGFASVFLPWAMRSLYLTGNPLFPYANRIFHSPLGRNVPSEWSIGVGTDFASILQIPVLLFTEPRRFAELGTFHPSFLVLAPIVVVAVVLGARRARFWGAATLLAAALWAFSMQNMRYGIVVAWCATMAGAIGLEDLHGRLRLRATQVLVGTATTLALLGLPLQHLHPVAWMWARHDGPGLPAGVVLGSVPRDEYCRDYLRTHAAAQFLNAQTTPLTHVLQLPPYLSDHASFRAKVTAFPHAVRSVVEHFDKIVFDRLAHEDHAAVHAELRRVGYSHLLYDGRAQDATPYAAAVYSDAFAARYLQLVHAHADVRLFAILPEARAQPGDRSESVAVMTEPRQRIAVKPGEIYVLRVTLGEASAGRTTMVLRWFDRDGKRRFTQGFVVRRAGTDYYQATPPGTSDVEFDFDSGGNPLRQVELRRVRAPAAK